MNVLFVLCLNVMQVKETVCSVVFLDFAVRMIVWPKRKRINAVEQVHSCP